MVAGLGVPIFRVLRYTPIQGETCFIAVFVGSKKKKNTGS